MLSAVVLASEKHDSPHVVSDPIAAYYRDHYAAEPIRGSAFVVEADFDCDGRSDFAISDAAQTGHAGASWVIYLRRPDGRFTEIGDVATKANRFHITRRKDGVGELAVMMRSGPGDLVVTFYAVSRTGLHKLRDERVLIPEQAPAKTRIDEIFGDGYSELPATAYTSAQLEAKFPK